MSFDADVGVSILSYLERSGFDYTHQGNQILVGPILVEIGEFGARLQLHNIGSWTRAIPSGEAERGDQIGFGRERSQGGWITVLERTHDANKVIAYIDSLLRPEKQLPPATEAV